MDTLEDYQKQQALDSIVGHFDCVITEIDAKELFDMVREEILKLTINTKNSMHSRIKIFSLYEVATIFIYQELSDTPSQSLFDSALNTRKHKESTSALIMIACEFANAYISLNASQQISQVNDVLIAEYQKLKEHVKDEEEVVSTKGMLFDKSGDYSIKTHLAKILKIQYAYHDKQDYTNKLFKKSDIYALLMLYNIYKDTALIQEYEALKTCCNISKTLGENLEKEMKYLANDYVHSQDKEFLQRHNLFYMHIAEKIRDHFFIRIDKAFIDEESHKIEENTKVVKWHHKIWMKKDHWLLIKNTMQIQKELLLIEQNHTHDEMHKHKFHGNHKVFSSISVMLEAHDKHFNTVERLSALLEHDFTGYFDVAGMNIKNFYESSTDDMEIEAINRLILFWMQISKKSLLKQLNKDENQLLI